MRKGRLTEHARGMGTVTREMVLKRAREIALINGRSEKHVLQSDFDQAKRELTGGGEMINDPEAPAIVRTPSCARRCGALEAAPRERVPRTMNRPMPRKLVEGGVMDAEHDRMVEGTREGLRRDTGND